jgi:hypothetical protein
LHGPALEFQARLPSEVRSNYASVVQRFQSRYGREELPLTKQFELHEVRQGADESLDAFAERVMCLVDDAYGEHRMDRTALEVIAVGALLTGCADHEAAATVFNLAPRTMQEALRLLQRTVVTNQLVVRKWGKGRRDMRVRFDQSPEGRVRRTSDSEDSPETRTLAEIKAIRQQVLALQSSLSGLQLAVDRVNQRQSDRESRRASPSPTPVGCYECGSENHFARDCPRRRARMTARSPSPRGRDRSPSPRPRTPSTN